MLTRHHASSSFINEAVKIRRMKIFPEKELQSLILSEDSIVWYQPHSMILKPKVFGFSGLCLPLAVSPSTQAAATRNTIFLD